MPQYVLAHLASGIIPWLPTGLGYWLFGWAGAIAFSLLPAARSNYLANLRHVLEPGVTERELAHIGRRGFQNIGKNYFDLFRAYRLTGDQVLAEINGIGGFDQLEDAMAKGRGAIGAAPHFGNFNMILHLIAVLFEHRYQVIVPVEHIRPEPLYRFFLRLRSSHGILLVRADQAGRAVIKGLRKGAFIGLAIDRDTTESGTVVDLFGQPARLPDGAVRLAIKYGAPIVLSFSRRLEDNRSTITLEPPLTLSNTGDLEADIHTGLELIAPILEKWLRAYPEQWQMIVPLWLCDQPSERIKKK